MQAQNGVLIEVYAARQVHGAICRRNVLLADVEVRLIRSVENSSERTTSDGVLKPPTETSLRGERAACTGFSFVC